MSSEVLTRLTLRDSHTVPEATSSYLQARPLINLYEEPGTNDLVNLAFFDKCINSTRSCE